MTMVSARRLVGRTIVAFYPCPFPDGRGGVAHEPTIWLDDGSRLYFITEETDVGDYGTYIGKTPAQQSWPIKAKRSRGLNGDVKE